MTATEWPTWDEVRAGIPTTPEREERIAALTDQMLAQSRARRLVEARKQEGLTQEQVAAAMGVGQSRVSRIEKGDVSAAEVDTLARYVEALGGTLRLVADFGDRQVRLHTPPRVAALLGKKPASRSRRGSKSAVRG